MPKLSGPESEAIKNILDAVSRKNPASDGFNFNFAIIQVREFSSFSPLSFFPLVL